MGCSIASSHYPGIDRPHSLKRGEEVYYYATEYPGHVVGLIDSTGALVNEYDYRPFGASDGKTEGMPNPLQYM